MDTHGDQPEIKRAEKHKQEGKKRERKGSIILNKNINTVTTRDTTIEQQKSAVPGQTAGARDVWCGPAAGSLPGPWLSVVVSWAGGGDHPELIGSS